MKVVQINATSDYGSTGRIINEISQYLESENIDNLMMCSYGKKISESVYYIGNKTDHKVHALFSRISGLQGYYSFRATKKMIKTLKNYHPDIVHLHNLHANYVNLPMLLKYLSNNDIATVITLHDCWFFTGKCTHYTTASCYKWKSGCGTCPKLKSDNKSWLFDRTKKMWKDKKKLFGSIPRLAVIGVSDWITEQANQSFLKSSSIIKRIYNWIDLDVFYPRSENIKDKYGIAEGKFTILCVSAMWNRNTEKYVDLIELSNLIDDSMQIVAVGRGINNGNLPDNIIGIEYINGQDELAKLYSAADVYVHLSREDTFGKVVAEAMACGTPVAAYNLTALPEIVKNDCGGIAECGNVGALLKEIIIIRSKKKQNYSNNCVNFVRNNFDKEYLLKETVDIYRDIMNFKRG